MDYTGRVQRCMQEIKPESDNTNVDSTRNDVTERDTSTLDITVCSSNEHDWMQRYWNT